MPTLKNEIVKDLKKLNLKIKNNNYETNNVFYTAFPDFGMQ